MQFTVGCDVRHMEESVCRRGETRGQRCNKACRRKATGEGARLSASTHLGGVDLDLRGWLSLGQEQRKNAFVEFGRSAFCFDLRG